MPEVYSLFICIRSGRNDPSYAQATCPQFLGLEANDACMCGLQCLLLRTAGFERTKQSLPYRCDSLIDSAGDPYSSRRLARGARRFASCPGLFGVARVVSPL